jgi:phosphate transport system substrate-binding protein
MGNRKVIAPKMKFFSVFRAGITFLIWLFAMLSAGAHAEEIKIGGTGNALGTMRLMGEAFSKKYPNMTVTVLGSIGTSGAIKGVPKGVIDIGVASRPLTDNELATGMVATEYARSLTVLAVANKLKVTAITSEQIADSYTGKLAKWPDGTPIRPVLRQPGDDNTKQIKSLSPEIEKALLGAERREGLAFAVIDQEAADKIENIPGAIGTSTLALIKSEGRPLRALKLDGVEPTERNGASGAYPLIKRFFFVTQKPPSSTVQQFTAFVNSPAGQEVLTKNGQWRP